MNHHFTVYGRDLSHSNTENIIIEIKKNSPRDLKKMIRL